MAGATPASPDGGGGDDVRTMAFHKAWIEIFRRAAFEFQRDRARRLGAGLAYYSLFALVPTALLAALIAAAFVGQEASEGTLVEQVEGVIGPDLAHVLEDAMAAMWETANTSGFALISVGVVIYSASVLFVAWRDTLEALWEVPYQPGLRRTIRSRVFGALVPIGAGVFLAAIVIFEMLVSLAEQFISSPALDAALRAAGTVFPPFVSVVALALIYRFTTKLRPAWTDIWPATLFTAFALAVLSWGYGLYMRFYGSSSVAGAAGSVVLGLAFVYYAAQLLLFGALVIRVYSYARDRPLRPADGAEASS